MENVGRKRRKNGFTQIANSLFEDNSLSWKAKGILCYLLSRPNNWKINKSDLQKRATEGRDSLQSGLNELKERGYLNIYSERNETGQIVRWVWEYDDIPFEATELKNHTTENPQESTEILQISHTTEKPSSGKTVVRKTRIYNNTDLNNTEINNTEVIKKIKTSIPAKILENEFEKLWDAYPKKKGKEKAKEKYFKLRKEGKAEYETVLNGIYRYIEYLEAEGTEKQYIMHGSTWFNQMGWQDEYIVADINSRPKNLIQMYQRDFGGIEHGSKRNASIFDYHEDGVSEGIPQSSYFFGG